MFNMGFFLYMYDFNCSPFFGKLFVNMQVSIFLSSFLGFACAYIFNEPNVYPEHYGKYYGRKQGAVNTMCNLETGDWLVSKYSFSL